MSLSITLVTRGVVRGIHVAASLSVFGTAASRTFILRKTPGQVGSGASPRVARSLTWLIRASLAFAIAAGSGWLVLEAIYIADTHRVTRGLAVLVPVIEDTNFARILITRLTLLSLAVIAFGNGRKRGGAALATGLAAIATALQAGLGHGAAMGGTEGAILLASLIIHLVAAGLWLGGLTPLLIALKSIPSADADPAVRRFSALGAICVVALILTATVQMWFLAGGLSGLVGTAYGRVATAKLALFAVLLGIAATNRFLFTPALVGPDGGVARSRLCRSIIAETLVGLIVIILAGILLELPPGMDLAIAAKT